MAGPISTCITKLENNGINNLCAVSNPIARLKVDAPKTNNLRDFSTRIGGVILEGDFSSEEK